MNPLNASFAPDAVNSARHKGVRFSQFRRTVQTIDRFLVRFDLLRREAESKEEMGGASPGASSSVISVQNASLCRPDKSPVLASAEGNLGMAGVVRQMRRLSGPMRGAAPQDALAVAEVGW